MGQSLFRPPPVSPRCRYAISSCLLANHGSALAVLGKQRVGRIKAWFSGIEPGSDGVVRVAGVNMNYRYFALTQGPELVRQQPRTCRLVENKQRPVRIARPVPLGVYAGYRHCGKKMGIMGSVAPQSAAPQPVVADILRCLQVEDLPGYQERAQALAALTEVEQAGKDRYAMLIVNIHDDQDNRFGRDDFDIFLLAGPNYQPQALPKGFFMDRQMNAVTSSLVYYLNVDKMNEIKDGLFGLRIIAAGGGGD